MTIRKQDILPTKYLSLHTNQKHDQSKEFNFQATSLLKLGRSGTAGTILLAFLKLVKCMYRLQIVVIKDNRSHHLVNTSMPVRYVKER